MQKIIIASGPVIVENNKVLLDKHGDDNFWKFCGGRVDNFSETLIDTARRRAKEEIGIDFEVLDNEPFFLYSQKETMGENVDIILVHFLAKRVGEIAKGDSVRELVWHDINKLPEDLAPNIIPVLKHFNLWR